LEKANCLEGGYYEQSEKFIRTEPRKARDFHLLTLKKETKIRAKYIQALEEENYDEIPGQPYLYGFSPQLCSLSLKIDPDPLVYPV